MKILITGGAGFIGGHLAERCLREGHDVTVLDNLDPFYDVRIKEHTIDVCRDIAGAANAAYTLVRGDIRNEEAVRDVVDPATVVYHIAGQAGVRESVEDPRRYDEINVEGTLNVLDAARDSGTTRVVIASSSSVYGTPEDLPYQETDSTRPVSPYGASKLAAERYGCAYSAVYDLPVVALRYFTVYGPRMRPNMAMTNFVSRCRRGEPPVVYGDGTQTRDFTYVDDVVQANLDLLRADGVDGEAINVGSTDRIQIKELARMVRDKIDPDLDIVFDERHAADAGHTQADVSKARGAIGYDPQYCISEGVETFIEWYQKNEDWYEPLVRAS